jgi:hypothetical protein
MYGHPDDVSDARTRRHYVLVVVVEIIFVTFLWFFSRTFS